MRLSWTHYLCLTSALGIACLITGHPISFIIQLLCFSGGCYALKNETANKLLANVKSTNAVIEEGRKLLEGNKEGKEGEWDDIGELIERGKINKAKENYIPITFPINASTDEIYNIITHYANHNLKVVPQSVIENATLTRHRVNMTKDKKCKYVFLHTNTTVHSFDLGESIDRMSITLYDNESSVAIAWDDSTGRIIFDSSFPAINGVISYNGGKGIITTGLLEVPKQLAIYYKPTNEGEY